PRVFTPPPPPTPPPPAPRPRTPPPTLGGRPRGPADPPPEADQAPRAGLGGNNLRAAVRGPGLGRRPKVQLRAVRELHQPPPAVEMHVAPAGYAARPHGPRSRVQAAGLRLRGLQEREVAVVADPRQRLPASRVDVAVGEPGRAQRRLDQLSEQLADAGDRAGGRVEPGELGVRPEPAAGQIDGRQLGIGDGAAGRYR